MATAQKTDGRTLFRIAGAGASVAFGVMVGTLFALRSVPDGFTFELNSAAGIAFIAAAVFAWFYWRTIERMALEKVPAQRKKRFILFSIGLVLVGVVSFLYPMKFIPAEKRRDVFIGLALAVGCIVGVGLVMWKVRNFLEADLKKSEDESQREE
jgi:membrane protease YdiL (CAAX protease family)